MNISALYVYLSSWLCTLQPALEAEDLRLEHVLGAAVVVQAAHLVASETGPAVSKLFQCTGLV